jgi:hypothetical protein
MQVHANCIALVLEDVDVLVRHVEELLVSAVAQEGARSSTVVVSLQREQAMELRWRASRDDLEVLQKQLGEMAATMMANR